MDIFKLFDRTGCPQRPLCYKMVELSNKGTFPRDYFINFTGGTGPEIKKHSRVMTVPLISEDAQPDENLLIY